MPAICDYEGSRYRTEFWTPERQFENLADRIALKALLPPHGDTLIEVGAGFGRLADLYTGYQQVVLFDYARTLLEEARERLQGDKRYLFVAGDVYRMPFATGTFDTLVMVRVLHHLEDVPAAFAQLARVARPQGTFILEFANKRHVKAIVRYLLRRQDWNPFDPAPHPFVPLNYDFHPKWVRAQLRAAGFLPQTSRAVSHFRIPVLKRYVPPRILARVDALLHRPGALLEVSPSVFIRSQAAQVSHSAISLAFRCPQCGYEPIPIAEEDIVCPQCGAVWPFQGGIYNFKESGNKA